MTNCFHLTISPTAVFIRRKSGLLQKGCKAEVEEKHMISLILLGSQDVIGVGIIGVIVNWIVILETKGY